MKQGKGDHGQGMNGHSRGIETQSLCPECLATIPALIRQRASGAVMEKRCPDHGAFEVVVSKDIETYRQLCGSARKVTHPARYGAHTDKGCPEDCGLCPSHEQHTCLAILEITSRCDLGCPVCLASSVPAGHDLEVHTAEAALKALIRNEGRPPPLQLSGGEPSLHRDLEAIIQRASSLGYEKVEIDTNGLRLARDPSFAGRLREAGLSQVYLQMDGLDADVSKAIRGTDLVERKYGAIENCRRAGLQVALSVTIVPGVNDHGLWEMIHFGMEQGVTGINFQSVTLSGRFPESLGQGQERFTLGHFIHGVEQQSGGRLLARELTPLPCPDPRCGVMTYALVLEGELLPLNRILRDGRLLGHVADMNDWDEIIRQVQLEGACGCGSPSACSGPPADLLALFDEADYYSIGFHGMMDAWNFDLDRARHCCIHELTPEGRLIPFCLYNTRYREPLSQRSRP
jgi:uncharacterized radical SAM superfamily Fe-S cluster-containing enzyme